MYKPSQRIITIKRSEIPSSIKVVLTSGGARLPLKVKHLPNSQSLTLIKRKGVEEDEVGKVTTFEVGLYFISPSNILLQMIASPSLISHGYMLSSGVMAVPNKQTFTIQLYKFREGPDLELPYDGIYLTALQSPPIFYKRSIPKKIFNPSNFNIPSEFSSSSTEFESLDINTLS
jgi:hypothetical protein